MVKGPAKDKRANKTRGIKNLEFILCSELVDKLKSIKPKNILAE